MEAMLPLFNMFLIVANTALAEETARTPTNDLRLTSAR